MDCWDETRLRALCKHHGWEFEWMAEDGERRRRMQEKRGRNLSVPASLVDAARMSSAPPLAPVQKEQREVPDGFVETVAEVAGKARDQAKAQANAQAKIGTGAEARVPMKSGTKKKKKKLKG